jgi:hypothetical protein
MSNTFTKEQIEEAFKNGLISETEAQEAERQRIKMIAAAERKAALKKKAAATPPPKYYYDVKVECMLPATLTYRVLAETPQQASEMIRGLTPNGVKHRLQGRKELKLSVYDAGSSMIKFVRNLFGG